MPRAAYDNNVGKIGLRERCVSRRNRRDRKRFQGSPRPAEPRGQSIAGRSLPDDEPTCVAGTWCSPKVAHRRSHKRKAILHAFSISSQDKHPYVCVRMRPNSDGRGDDGFAVPEVCAGVGRSKQPQMRSSRRTPPRPNRAVMRRPESVRRLVYFPLSGGQLRFPSSQGDPLLPSWPCTDSNTQCPISWKRVVCSGVDDASAEGKETMRAAGRVAFRLPRPGA